MKRLGDHDERLSKRARAQSSFLPSHVIQEHFTVPLCVEDLRAGAGLDNGYLEGVIYGIQGSTVSFRIPESHFSPKPQCVNLRLDGQWARKIQLSSGDHIFLSTKGANITLRGSSSNNKPKLPLLTYLHGVSLVISRRMGSSTKAEEVYDVWTEGTPRMSNSHSRALPIQNTLTTPEDAGFKLEGSDATAVGSPRDFSISRDNMPTVVSSQTTPIMEDKDIAVSMSMTARLTHSQSPAVISSDEQKSVPLGHSEYHLGKQNRRGRRIAGGISRTASDSTPPEHLLPLSEDPMEDGVSTHEKHPTLPTPLKAKTETLSRNPTPSTTAVDADGIPIFQCGLRTINGDYIPLSAVKIGKVVSVIAVVTSVRNVIRTRKGDWSQSVSLIDPSNFEQFGRMLYTEGAGIKLNCFSTIHASWVPLPRVGDVLVARMARVKSHQDSPSLIGYTDKLEWTLFQPDTHKFTHGDLKDAPRSANLAGGYGAEFSPFWTGTEQEREYCLKICEWWAAVQRARGKRMGSDIVQIGGGDGPVEIGRYAPRKFTTREHRLIKDADGYFNCTVEVLHGQSLSPGMYTIWVTDYTSKQGAQEVTTEWCPANLSTKVFRVELWEEAVDLGPKMKPGEFWSIGNMRMKTDSRGFYEGSFSEVRKAHRLEPDEAQYNPYLKELFDRKEVWEESNVSPNEFPHKTLAEVTLSEIFDCTVEVFHTEPNPDGTSRVYVSDYTERPDLTRPPRAARVEGMDNYIVTIELRDGQSEMASMMETGSFFRIGHLRLQKRYTGDGKVLGQLGGHDRLINKVSKNAKDPGLVSLLHRKEAWLAGMDAHPSEHKPPSVIPKVNATSTTKTTIMKRRPGYSSVKEILSSEHCPSTFRLHARVTDFFPMSLRDCIVLSCGLCDHEVAGRLPKCSACGGSEHRYVFRLFFCLEDDSIEEPLLVHVDGGWSELAGLLPAELAKEDDPTDILLDRLGDSIGNLVQVHDTLGEVQLDTSPRDFTITSWAVPSDETGEGPEIAYGLR